MVFMNFTLVALEITEPSWDLVGAVFTSILGADYSLRLQLCVVLLVFLCSCYIDKCLIFLWSPLHCKSRRSSGISCAYILFIFCSHGWNGT